MDLPPIEQLQALHLEPGDALVVTVDERSPVTPEQIAEWAGLFERALPGTRVLFTTGDIELSVIRSES